MGIKVSLLFLNLISWEKVNVYVDNKYFNVCYNVFNSKRVIYFYWSVKKYC